MARPTKPTVPSAPVRTSPSTFSDDAEAMFKFLQTFVNYLDDTSNFTMEQANDALAAAIAGNLSALDLAALAGQPIAVNSAGTALTSATLGSLNIASQAEAEAGTDNTRVMTALRTKQAYDEFSEGILARVKIVTKSANNSANINFSGSNFNSSKYKDYEFVFDNIVPVSDRTDLYIRPSDDGGTTSTSKIANKNHTSWSTGNLRIADDIGTSVDETGFSGIMTIFDFHADKGAQFVLRAVYTNHSGSIQNQFVDSGMLQRPSVDGALNHIRFHMSSGNISAGSITLYGLY